MTLTILFESDLAQPLDSCDRYGNIMIFINMYDIVS